jgi:hypothetical protein
MIGMNILAMLFYGLLGLSLLYLIIHYAVKTGIDSSAEVRLLRDEIGQIKKQLEKT